MSIPCDMIRDLADKCESGEASAETRAAVESHLEGCESCRRYYESRRAAVISAPHLRVEAGGADEALIAESLRKLSKRLHTRRTIGAVCAAATAAIGLSALLYDVISDYKKGGSRR